jgi:small multidrug resistance pump
MSGSPDRRSQDGGGALQRYRPWLFAAACYNLVWGTVAVCFPAAYFDLIRIPAPNMLPLWQVLGMYLLVFVPGYWWAARDPVRHGHLVLIGLLGKTLGPLGFGWAVASSQLPLAFGLTILTNDLLWWPAFALFARDAARLAGGWGPLSRGKLPVA